MIQRVLASVLTSATLGAVQRCTRHAARGLRYRPRTWGVPSFQVDDRPGWWGQDRLWMIEDDLRAATGLPAIDRRMA
ncbi:MAG: hypothetical protein C0500_10500 [Sphingobium sp.]|nr:hypothetical protein [Sphingobium sp.]